MSLLRDIQYRLKQLLGESGGIEFVLDELTVALRRDSAALNDLVQLKSRYNATKTEYYLKGTIEYKGEFEKVSNSVVQGLLLFLDNLRENDLRPPEDADALAQSVRTLALDLDRATQTVFLVNCDRTQANRDFRTAAKAKRELPLHFCVVLACPFQTPHSFAERLVLEEVSRLEADPEARPYFRRRDESRLLIPALPVELDAEESLDAFRRDFARYHADFFQKKQQYTQAAFAFALHEKNWDDFLPEYVEAVALWLQQLAIAARQRCLFFLVIYVENLHCADRLLPGQLLKNDQLLALTQRHSAWMTGLSALPTVPADEIEKWMHKVSQHGFAPSADEVLAQFAASVQRTAPTRFRGVSEFDMFDVEKIQALVHQLAKSTAHQQVQSNL